MLAANQNRRGIRLQKGTTAVEFAVVVVIFLTIVFGILELARYMYVINTLQEVTRRAAAEAANTDFRNSAAKDEVRKRAMLSTSGELPLGDPVTYEYVKIDYLALARGAGATSSPTVIPASSLPDSVAKNRVLCTMNQNDPSCVRLVMVRICVPGSDCDPPEYQPIFPLIPLNVPLIPATTIVTAETLGSSAGLP